MLYNGEMGLNVPLMKSASDSRVRVVLFPTAREYGASEFIAGALGFSTDILNMSYSNSNMQHDK